MLAQFQTSLKTDISPDKRGKKALKVALNGSKHKKKNRQSLTLQRFLLVSPAGFEPTTF